MQSNIVKPLFYERSAIAGWVFMGIWFLFLTMFTYLFLRDGGTGQMDYEFEAMIFLVFWAVGLAGGSHCYSIPIVKITKADECFKIRLTWLHKAQEYKLAFDELPEPRIHTNYDSDGDTYSCLFKLPDGYEVCFASYNDMQDAKSDCEKFLAAAKNS